MYKDMIFQNQKHMKYGGNIFLNMNMKEFVTYEVDNYTSLPK